MFISSREFLETCNIMKLRWYFTDMAKIINLAITVENFVPEPEETENLQRKGFKKNCFTLAFYPQGC